MTAQEKKAVLFILFLLSVGGIGFSVETPSSAPPQIEEEAPHPIDTTSSITPPVKPLVVSINTATLVELQKLPGIGPKIAQRILEYREKYGPFHSIQELQKVKGIGPKKMTKLIPYLK